MATVTTEDLRNMTPLRVANHTVGKPDETLAMMEEDGYVYFRDVLDQGAVGRLRKRYMDVLVDWGVVDPGASEPIWNGADLSTFPEIGRASCRDSGCQQVKVSVVADSLKKNKKIQ